VVPVQSALCRYRHNQARTIQVDEAVASIPGQDGHAARLNDRGEVPVGIVGHSLLAEGELAVRGIGRRSRNGIWQEGPGLRVYGQAGGY